MSTLSGTLFNFASNNARANSTSLSRCDTLVSFSSQLDAKMFANSIVVVIKLFTRTTVSTCGIPGNRSFFSRSSSSMM